MVLPAPYTLTLATDSERNPVGPALDPVIEPARRFLRLANLPNFALDRLSRHEATLWRQSGKPICPLPMKADTRCVDGALATF
jgi:hypothetical protein